MVQLSADASSGFREAGPSAIRTLRESTSDFSSVQQRTHVVFESVTGLQDLRQDQFYFGFAGPPEDWSDIKRSDGTPFSLRPEQIIMKFGQHTLNTARSVTHTREYGIFSDY